MFHCPLIHASYQSVTKFLGEPKWFWPKHTFNWKSKGMGNKHLKGFPALLTRVKVMFPTSLYTHINTSIHNARNSQLNTSPTT